MGNSSKRLEKGELSSSKNNDDAPKKALHCHLVHLYIQAFSSSGFYA